MKGLGGEKKHLQHNIVELFTDIPTIPDNKAFMVNRHKHTHTHTYKRSKWFSRLQFVVDVFFVFNLFDTDKLRSEKLLEERLNSNEYIYFRLTTMEEI